MVVAVAIDELDVATRCSGHEIKLRRLAHLKSVNAINM